ncbi:MAG TPA: potassium channel family protein [Capillimicrobium sp.]|nr:potassium channel family protein [Capillimicrobium sp.]
MDDAFEAAVPRWLRTASLVAALLTVPAVLLDETEGLPSGWDTFGDTLNWVVWSVFLLTLVVALARGPSAWAVLKSNPVLAVVVVLTVPLMPPQLQIVRLARLGALLGAAHHARRLFSVQGLRYATAILGLVVVGGGVVFSGVEHGYDVSAADGIWFAIETVTTVGYGDIVPHTEAGRVVATVIMAAGIGTAALIVGAAAQRFVVGDADEDGADGDAPSLAELHGEIKALRSELATLREEIRQAGSG